MIGCHQGLPVGEAAVLKETRGFLSKAFRAAFPVFFLVLETKTEQEVSRGGGGGGGSVEFVFESYDKN